MFKAVFKHSVNDDKPQWSKFNKVGQFSGTISSKLQTPFIDRQLACLQAVTSTFLSTTARPAPPRRVLSKMAATKKRTPGFLAEEKLQRLQVG